MRVILTTVLLVAVCVGASASHYRLQESSIDSLFKESVDVGYLTDPLAMAIALEESATLAASGGKSQTTAGIIALAVAVGGNLVASTAYSVIGIVTLGAGYLFCWPILLAPLFPYHRYYLGTGGEGFKISALYCVTLSWCGWLHIIDGIMLLIDDDNNTYMDNPKYVMWLD